MQIIPASSLAESPWPNGAGRKTDIASGPGWLIGFARLERDAPFSDYAGHDRTITLVEGNGFTLDLPEGSVTTVDRPNQPAAFDGKGPIACRLLAGPCTVLNVITRYPGSSHTVQVVGGRDLADIMPGPGVFLVVLLGSVQAANTQAQPRDTVSYSAPGDLQPSPDALVAAIQIGAADEGEDDEA